MTIKRMDNIGIIVESLDTAISFFTELGLKLEGRAMVEGEWAGRVTGATTEFAERRFEQLGLRERRRFALLQISRGPWYAWLLREHPEFTPVEVYRWRQLEWLVFERRDVASKPTAKPAANPAAGS